MIRVESMPCRLSDNCDRACSSFSSRMRATRIRLSHGELALDFRQQLFFGQRAVTVSTLCLHES